MNWRRFWWLLPAALHGVLLWLYYQPSERPLIGDEVMYQRAAGSVVEHGSSQLESFWPPAYAWFLAPLIAVAGGGVWLAQCVQIGLLLVAAWLLGTLVELALDDRWAARASVLLTLTFPPLAAFSHYLWPEVLHLTLMLGAIQLLLRFGPRIWSVALAGLLLGLCLQTKVLLLPLLPILGFGLWSAWPPGRRLRAMGVLAATIALTVLPTLLAQQRDFGRPMLADSGWFNLWIGLNEVSRTEFVDSIVREEYVRYRGEARSAGARARIARDKIRDLVADRGWRAVLKLQLGRQYHRLFGRDSFLTHQLDRGTWRQRGQGYSAGDSVAGRALRWLSYGLWAVVLAGAAWGIAVFPYRLRPLGAWVLGFLLVQCAFFLVLHVKTRYRVQMLPGLFFFTVYAAAWWKNGGLRQVEGGKAVLRCAAGGSLALALLWLAFAAG